MECKPLETNLPVGVITDNNISGGCFTASKKISQAIVGKLIVLSSEYDKTRDFSDLLIPIKRIFGKRLVVDIQSLRKVNKQISLWHIHYPTPMLAPLFFLSKKPKIITFHYMFLQSPFLLSLKNGLSGFFNYILFLPVNIFLINIGLLFSSNFSFITEAQLMDFRKRCFFKVMFDNKSVVVQNFIENDIIKKETPLYSSFSILFVGRYTTQKGFFDLLRVAEQVREENFFFAGNDTLDSKLPNVKNLGKIENSKIIDEYDKHTLFILPSYTEVFPMSILEAMARGLVILVSDIPGMREIVSEGRNGYLFPIGDIDKMKELILFLKNNPQEVERISKNNLEDIWQYTSEKVVPKYIKLYEDALGVK